MKTMQLRTENHDPRLDSPWKFDHHPNAETHPHHTTQMMHEVTLIQRRRVTRPTMPSMPPVRSMQPRTVWLPMKSSRGRHTAEPRVFVAPPYMIHVANATA